MKIITNYWPKPIPDRQFDWSAMEDGGDERFCGWGPTEDEARADLRRLQQERSDYEEGDDES